MTSFGIDPALSDFANPPHIRNNANFGVRRSRMYLYSLAFCAKFVLLAQR